MCIPGDQLRLGTLSLHSPQPSFRRKCGIESRHQAAVGFQAEDDVATADQLATQEQLRVGRPLRDLRQLLADMRCQ